MPPKIIEYITCYSNSPIELDQKVYSAIKDGYQPYCQQNVVYDDLSSTRGLRFVQVMVKYEVK